jgi:hypothetical protein
MFGMFQSQRIKSGLFIENELKRLSSIAGLGDVVTVEACFTQGLHDDKAHRSAIVDNHDVHG